MSEIKLVLDEINKCKKHAKDGICFSFLGLNVYFFFRIDALITLYIITHAQLCCRISIFFEKVNFIPFSRAYLHEICFNIH